VSGDNQHVQVARVTRRRLILLGSAGVAAMYGLRDMPTSIAQAAPGPRTASDGILKMGLSNEPPNLDPHQTSAAISSEVMADCFDTLVVGLENQQIVPSLATAWSRSKDGKEITFHLRTGVTFHDGTPFNALAMKQSFDRMVDPATKSGLAASLLGPYKGSRTIDDHTLTMAFSTPFAPLLQNLTQLFTAPVSPAAIKRYGLGLATHPIGTGPFAFKEWVKQDHISFVRNPKYRWAPAFFGRNGPPALQEITWKPVAEDATRIATLQDGESNIIESFPPTFLQQFKSDNTYVVDVKMRTGLPFSLMVNTQKAPCNDLRVRQALEYGIDKNSISRVLTFGLNPPAHGPLSPVTFGYWPGAETMYPYNPTKAKALLDQAGWIVGSDGIRQKGGQRLHMEFWTLSDIVEWQNIAEAFQAEMKVIGIDIKIVSQARAAWGAGVMAGKHHLTVQIFTLPDPSVLSINFHSKNIGGQGFNWSRYANPTLDHLLDEGDVTFDLATRKKVYQQAQQIIMDNAVVIPVFINEQAFGRLATIEGITYVEGGQPLFYATHIA